MPILADRINSLELSPHVANNVADAIEALGVALGPGVVLSYVWAGLYHPARRIREVCLAADYSTLLFELMMISRSATGLSTTRYTSDIKMQWCHTILGKCSPFEACNRLTISSRLTDDPSFQDRLPLDIWL